MSFYDWLVENFKHTRSPIGDLARDVAADETLPKNAGNREIKKYLDDCSACADCIYAFEEAWNEYRESSVGGVLKGVKL